MSGPTDKSSTMLGPSAVDTFPDGSGFDTITGSGSTEDSNSTALTVGRMATLLVGSVAVSIALKAATGASTQVTAATSVQLPAYGRLDWVVTPTTRVVYQEATAGSGTHISWLWHSSPK